VIYIETWVTLSLLGVDSNITRKGGRADERASQKGKEQEYPTEGTRANIPQWAQGLHYNSGPIKEVLVYHDDEAIYFGHRGKESGIVRFTFEMIEGLKIVEEEHSADSQEE
jgi:hypothetical protein